jgi:hypothetical protein
MFVNEQPKKPDRSSTSIFYFLTAVVRVFLVYEYVALYESLLRRLLQFVDRAPQQTEWASPH